MATSVTLPALGESVTEGTVTRWLKQEGDTVEADEPLLEVSTDKVDTEIPSPAAGTLLSIKVQEDETVEVGAELAVIGDSADDSGSSGGDTDAGSGSAEPAAMAPADSSDGVAASGTANASPEATAGEASPEPQAAANDTGSAGGSGSGGSGSGGAGGDSVSVTLPALGESVTEGTVTRWLKKEGDTVEEDEPLVEVSTDKVDTEIPSPAAGTLLSISVQEDETVEVGAQLAVIGSPSSGGGSSSGDVAASSADAGDLSGGELAKTADADVPADEKPAFVEEKALADKQGAENQATDSGAAPADQSSGQAASGSGSGSGSASPNAGLPSDAAAPSAPATSNVPAQVSTAGSSAPAPSKTPAVAVSGAPTASNQAASNGSVESSGDGAYVTPLVRKLAAGAGVDLGSITGTGVGGRIRKQDVTAAADAKKAAEVTAAADTAAAPAPAAPAAAESKPTSPAPAPSPSSSLRGQTVKMTRMRAFIAKRMVESLQVSAQLTTVVEVDVTQIARLRKAAQAGFIAREGVKLSFLPFFAKAAIEALRAYPQVNSSINSETNEVTYHGAEHLGVAVDTERGLIVPVIHDAGDLNIGGLARKIADLAERTRDNKISPDELSGGTFTLTNTGSRGALFDTPILNQPQVGILGTGAVVKRPVVIDDPRLGETIVVRSMVYLALTYDHRIVDGADAARFLTSMKQRLEEGQFETDLGL